MFRLQEEQIKIEKIKDNFKNPAYGALVSFEGIVRADRKLNKEVRSLLYVADKVACMNEGEKIIQESIALYPIQRAACVQRINRVMTGESAVWIGVWSVHRMDSFNACQYIIENIKKRLIIWKKEYFTDGSSQWIYGAETPILEDQYVH